MTVRRAHHEPLAIVGIGCRFPGGSDTPGAFWQLLRKGRSAIRVIPADRFSLDQFYDNDPNVSGKINTKYGGFIDNVRDFDAQFFGISPREAEAMDPQQRLILTVVWEAFENAGIPAERLKKSNTAVFMGASSIDYAQIQRYRRGANDLHAGTGSAMSIISNRVSHKYDFHGPSATVDTACSSSLTATDLACNAIWRGQSDLAVVGGVNVLLDPTIFISFSKANMLSKTGRVRTFDASADGFVRAEGAGAIVLKPLSRALADRDRVYAVIKGTAVNQDGNTSTISVPSADAQVQMLSAACASAGLSPSDIDFVEAHGTGTPIGDPIEARAIGRAFGRERNRKQRVLVGAVKTNTGHLEAGAGITGLIKTALSLHHREIPRNLNFKSPNPNIPLDDLGLSLPLEHMEWKADGDRPRRAAVNSFGIGGTNACAVLEEAPAALTVVQRHDHPYKNYWFIPLGAQSDKALSGLAADTAKAIKGTRGHANGNSRANGNGHANGIGNGYTSGNGHHQDVEAKFEELAANLALRRSHLTFRAAAVANTHVDIEKILKGAPRLFEAKKTRPGLISGKRQEEPKICFVFAGQGGTWWGMAHGLLRDDPVFAKAVDEFDHEFQKQSDWSVREELLRTEAEFHPGTTYTLPCLFALQTGLVARWRAWGVKPKMVMGHSSGELATAYAAGMLTMADAAKIVHHRSRLQATQEGRGGIAAIALPRHEVERRLTEWEMTNVDIAAVNGPAMVNIAGDNAALHEVVKRLKEQHGEDLFARVLKVDFAPHCHHMDPLRTELLESLASVRPHAGTVPMISTVTGSVIGGEMADNMYWWRNIRDPVSFDAGLREALKLGANIFVEIGPHANLAPMISGALAETGQSATVVSSLKRDEPHEQALMTAVSTLYVAGVDPDWKSFYGDAPQRVDLPRYPWEAKTFWIDTEEMQAALRGPRQHPLLGPRSFGPTPTWTSELSLEELPYLQDHAVDGSVIFPGAGYLETMFAAGRELFGEGTIELENVEILEAMILSSDRTEMVQTSFEPSRSRIQIMSRPRGGNLDWVVRARATLRIMPGSTPDLVERMKAPKGKSVTGASIYKKIAERGYAYGPRFQGVRKIWPGSQEATAWIQGRDVDTAKYNFHPALLDASLHAGFGLASGFGVGLDGKSQPADDRIYLPVRIDRVTMFRSPGREGFYARARTVLVDHNAAVSDTSIADAKGRSILLMEGFRAKAIPVRKAHTESKVLKPVFVTEDLTKIELERAAKDAGEGHLWLAFANGASDLTTKAAASLKKAGAEIVTVSPGEAFKKLGDAAWRINPKSPDDIDQLLSELAPADAKSPRKISGVLFGWALTAALRTEGFSLEELAETEVLSSNAALALVQALVKRPDQKPRLWLLTRGAYALNDADEKTLAQRLATASLQGFARTALGEQADLQCSTIDLDPGQKARRQADGLAVIVLTGTPETELVLRGDDIYAPRVRQSDHAALPATVVPPVTKQATRLHKLTMSELGDLDNLRFVEVDAEKPGKGQVKIAVKAGALNFHDILGATAVLPADSEHGNPADNLGLECAGTIIEVGPGVKGKRVGDRVMAMTTGCFRSEVLIEADGAHKLPKHVSFTGAATIPSAFSTAYYALTRQAYLRAGETVLVHLASGGVGLAAIQIARHFKAKVIATAGSPEKRAFLKKLGVEHVFDSRALAFANQIRRVTNGRGVDVVINALAGEAIPLGISVLAPRGRFIEIGKRDLYGDSALGMRGFRLNASFHVLDMARINEDDPEGLKEIFAEINDLLAKKKFKPLQGETFKASQMIDAFKLMAKAKHIGKVVIDFDDPDLRLALSTRHPIAIDKTGAYLITGGLGGFGAETARWLADRGARHLYLLGRSGLTKPEAKALIAELKGKGVKAHAIAADATKRADIDAALAQIKRDHVSLKGVVHSAMVLDDGFITQLNAERMLTAIVPKVAGAWNLHEATAGIPLDFFVMYSSLASVFGSAGQANYVAGNRFLDLLAQHRRALGLPALTINWGALGGAGAVQRNKDIARYLKSMGMEAMNQTDAFTGLGAVMRKEVSGVGVCKIDWRAMARTNSGIRKIPRFSEVAAESASGTGGGRVRSELVAAKGPDRERLLKDYLGQQIARVLKVDVKLLDGGRPLNEFGLDSLTSFQLKNRIESDIGISVPVGKFLQKPTIESLAKTIAELLEAAVAERATTGATAKAQSNARILSSRQEWLWHRLRQDGPMPMHGMMELINVASIKPAIHLERLQAAFHDTIARHEVLRSHFPAVEGAPRVETLPVERFVVQGVDATRLDEAGFMDELRQLANTPHNVETGPLIDLRVFRRPEGENVIVLRSHVLLGDAWSYSLVFRELLQRYFGATPAEEAKPYLDFARWQRTWLASDEAKRAQNYWLKKLANLPAPLKLGDGDPGSINPHARGSYVRRFIAADAAWPARERTRELGLSMHALFGAAYHALLHAQTGATDIVLSSNVANRTRTEHENMIGWLANVMLTRCKLDPSATLKDHAARLSNAMIEGIEHTGYPIHALLDQLGKAQGKPVAPHFAGFNVLWPENTGRTGFERVMFAPTGTLHKFGEMEFKLLPVGVEGVGHFLNDTAVTYQEADGDLLFMLHARDGVFGEGQADAFLDRYLRILEAALKNPEATIGDLAKIG
jgi:acyl transferase domain-containing protein/NADPH:quinone reductase-like Zn-dependent oxidoreductase/acyl carrier protein